MLRFYSEFNKMYVYMHFNEKSSIKSIITINNANKVIS
jgi:hypothetical protein